MQLMSQGLKEGPALNLNEPPSRNSGYRKYENKYSNNDVVCAQVRWLNKLEINLAEIVNCY